MDTIELQVRTKAQAPFDFKTARTPGRFIFQAKDLQIGYDSPLTKPLNLAFERNQRLPKMLVLTVSGEETTHY